ERAVVLEGVEEQRVRGASITLIVERTQSRHEQPSRRCRRCSDGAAGYPRSGGLRAVARRIIHGRGRRRGMTAAIGSAAGNTGGAAATTGGVAGTGAAGTGAAGTGAAGSVLATT